MKAILPCDPLNRKKNKKIYTYQCRTSAIQPRREYTNSEDKQCKLKTFNYSSLSLSPKIRFFLPSGTRKVSENNAHTSHSCFSPIASFFVKNIIVMHLFSKTSCYHMRPEFNRLWSCLNARGSRTVPGDSSYLPVKNTHRNKTATPFL